MFIMIINFFHFDFEGDILHTSLYNFNSILPGDIVARNIYKVNPNAHCRFDAVSREYRYYVFQKKNPFLQERAYYYPYTLDIEKLSEAASVLSSYTNFTSFSKRNTQVKNFECTILKSEWHKQDDCYVYNVQANRFLRGMVRGLVGTMLQVGRGKTTIEGFKQIITSHDCSQADFSVPGCGLFLVHVNYPVSIGIHGK